jgi:FtsP/CotA-like multicopper oxidase with cupredoxin domain
MKNFFRNGVVILVATICLASTSKMVKPSSLHVLQDTLRIDHDYVLEATMLGYFAKDGTRNPTLKANKGKRVRITIYNGEMMTHDISL